MKRSPARPREYRAPVTSRIVRAVVIRYGSSDARGRNYRHIASPRPQPPEQTRALWETQDRKSTDRRRFFAGHLSYPSRGL